MTTATTIPTLILDCVTAPRPGFGTDTPWVAGSRILATNGRIAVSCPKSSLNLAGRDLSPRGQVPDIASFFGGPRWETEAVPVPEPEEDGQPLVVGTVGIPDGSRKPWSISSVNARWLRDHGITTLHLPLAPGGPARFQAGDILGIVLAIKS